MLESVAVVAFYSSILKQPLVRIHDEDHRRAGFRLLRLAPVVE